MTQKRNIRYVILGAGMSGILAGVNLLRSGETNFIIIEKRSKVGGTWFDNKYPGLTCDVPAHAYTYSFAPNPEWSAFFAPGPEIQQYFEKVVSDHGLHDKIRLNVEAIDCTYNETSKKWQLRFSDGQEEQSDVVIAATGVLRVPNIPDFKGLSSFEGVFKHSARWSNDVDLNGKNAAVIGSGSTGVQAVCAIRKQAGQLVHLQRSPQWIMPVENFDYTDEQREAFRQTPQLIEDIRQGEEYWDGIKRFNKAIIHIDSPEMKEIERIVFENLEHSVKDQKLKELLTPDYRAACKRLVYSGEYYHAVQQDNVRVDTSAISHFERDGIRMQDGQFYPLDVVVSATGFKADQFMRPMTIMGKNGVTLEEFWRKRATAYLAVSMPDFPNFFMLNGPTGPVGNFSLIDIAEQQWNYIDQLLELLRRREATEIFVSRKAMEGYDERRITAAKSTIFGTGCSSWYLDSEGVPATWPWGYEGFVEAMSKPNMDHYQVA